MVSRIESFAIKIQKKLFNLIWRPLLSETIRKFPVDEKKIVFDNFCGKGFGDNPRYIAEELLKKHKEIRIVWLLDNLRYKELSAEFPPEIKLVKIESVKALYERATAKAWVDNVRHYHPVRKKSNQVYLQTWHGPFSPKRVEGDAEPNLSSEYIKEARYDGKISDAILANSRLQKIQFERAFWLGDDTEVLCYGLPRNDLLLNKKDDKEVVYKVRKHFGINADDFVVLYAPTFRDDYSVKGYQLDFARIQEEFSKITRRNTYIIIKLHPNVSFQKRSIGFNAHILDGTNYSSIQELSIASDAVISDYSTSILDFALLRKPAFVCALDLEEYEKTRGLLKEFYSFPFSIAYTNEELISNIFSFNKQEYDKKVDAYFLAYPFYDTGNASAQVAQWLVGKMRGDTVMVDMRERSGGGANPSRF